MKDVCVIAHNDRYPCVTMNIKCRESLEITGYGLCDSHVELELLAMHSQEIIGDGQDFRLISKRSGLDR